MDGRNGATSPPAPAYREQMVEIALGPKATFENGNVGAVTRQVNAEQVVSAVPRRRSPLKPARAPWTPRVVELLREAIEWQAVLDSGETPNQATIALREGITRARVTQILGMLRLAPEIQQRILSMPEMVRQPVITERALRPVAQIENPDKQIAGFRDVIGHIG